MKKFQQILCLFPLLISLIAARAEVPATTTTAPASSAPVAADSSATAAAPAVDPAKEVEIRKLLELTGTTKMTQQVMNQMISSFRTRNNTVSSEFWDRFEKEMNIQELVDKIVPVYAKYYTIDDLRAINAFYQTPAGQRVLAATPQIMQASMQIGQTWGRQVAERLIAELKEEREKAAASAPAASTNAVPASPAAPTAP